MRSGQFKVPPTGRPLAIWEMSSVCDGRGIGAEGQLGDDRRYVAEIDLPMGNVIPRDIYFAFGNLQQRGESQIGHFREPFSLGRGTKRPVLCLYGTIADQRARSGP